MIVIVSRGTKAGSSKWISLCESKEDKMFRYISRESLWRYSYKKKKKKKQEVGKRMTSFPRFN